MANLTRPGSGSQVGHVTIRFKPDAKLAILRSKRVENALLAIAERVARNASRADDANYVGWSDAHGLSAHAHATTTDWESIVKQAESQSLVAALGDEKEVL